MEIRKLLREEHEKTRPLYEEVFAEDSEGFVEYYYTEKTRDNQIYVIEEDNQIQSMIHLNPYDVVVNGVIYGVHYIVAVATREAYRRRGYMGALLRTTLREMCQEGQPFTFLMPAAEAIYTPYDFRTVYEQKIPPCGTGEASLTRLPDGSEFAITPLEEKDCRELAEAANRELAESYQVYAHRTAAYYTRLRKEYASDGAKLMLYRWEGRIIGCRPYVAEEESGEPAKIMIRILNVRTMLEAVRFREAATVTLRVTDPVIPENNRQFVVTGDADSTHVREDDVAREGGVITVAALASFLFGAKSIGEICAEEGVHLPEPAKEALSKLLPLCRIYLNEVV